MTTVLLTTPLPPASPPATGWGQGERTIILPPDVQPGGTGNPPPPAWPPGGGDGGGGPGGPGGPGGSQPPGGPGQGSEPPEAQPGNKKVWIVLAIVAGAILVAGIVVYAYGAGKRSASTPTTAPPTTVPPSSTTTAAPTTTTVAPTTTTVAPTTTTTTAPAATATISLANTQIGCASGAGVLLTWSSTNATGVQVTGPGFGRQDPNGAVTVGPSQSCAGAPFTDTYTIVARNSSSQSTASASIRWTRTGP